MTTDLIDRLKAAMDADELWALAASKPYHSDEATVAGGMHWVWGVGDNWDHYEPDPLEEFLGENHQAGVALVTKEKWPYSWGSSLGPGAVLTGVEEVRTADAAHIIRHDPARVLRQVAAHRKILDAREANSRQLAEHQAEWLSLMRTPGGAHYDKQQDRHLIQQHLSKLHGRQEAFDAMVSAIAEAYGIEVSS